MAGELRHDNGGRLQHDGDWLHARDRRPESVVLEFAPLACVEAMRHPVRGGAHQAEATRLQGRNLAPYALGKGARAQDQWGVVWDSLAILEFLAERHPEYALWPREEEPRAAARSISAEMHAGFATLRHEMPMDLLGRMPSPPIDAVLESEIRRVVAIWKDTRARFGAGGPFLFGAFTNADAMYVPVATRFRTYGVDLARYGDDGTAARYAAALLALPAMAEWTEGAEAETRSRTA
jgi:glutathione S-transferase